MANDNSREAFEKWQIDDGYHEGDMKRADYGNYIRTNVELEWRAWQAAEARNEAMNEYLRDLLKAGLAIIADITEARGYIESSTTIHILDCERALANTPSTKDE